MLLNKLIFFEDPENNKGGSHVYTLPNDVSLEDLDKMWLEVVCALVGESVPESKHVKTKFF